LSVPLLLPYVLEPVFVAPAIRWAIPGLDAERRAEADARLQELVARHAEGVQTETIILTGDPSEEVVKLARARDAGLIVMGLHTPDLLGPRMGSVTYRVLSMIDALVLAIPPGAAPSVERPGGEVSAASKR